MRNSIRISALTALVGIAISAPAAFAQSYFTGVQQVFVDDTERFGGCMALLVVSPHTVNANCGVGWITMDCTGTHTSKSAANQKLGVAQLALVSKTKVRVTLDDTRGHGGHCLATRMDNTGTPR